MIVRVLSVSTTVFFILWLSVFFGNQVANLLFDRW